jgi:hypothetical protein
MLAMIKYIRISASDSEQLGAAKGEQFSTEELSRPACVISTRLARSYVGQADYENEKALDAAIEEARRALPEVRSAYKPTGKTTVAATLLMFLVSPLVLLILLGVCGALCWGWASLVSKVSPDQSYGSSRLLGLVSLFLDLVLVILLVVIPMACYLVMVC